MKRRAEQPELPAGGGHLPEPEPAAPVRRRVLMTEADWERVRRDVERAERRPDPAQIVLPIAGVKP